MAPAWGGVLGGALTTAANAYLDTVLNEPYERMRKRKAELELDRLEGQIALEKAHAQYYGRPTGTGTKFFNTKLGPVLVYPDGTYKRILPEQVGPVTLKGLKDQMAEQYANDQSLFYDPEWRERATALGVFAPPYVTKPAESYLIPSRPLTERTLNPPGEPTRSPTTPPRPTTERPVVNPPPGFDRADQPPLPGTQTGGVVVPGGMSEARIAYYEAYFRGMNPAAARKLAMDMIKEDPGGPSGPSIRTFEIAEAMGRVMNPGNVKRVPPGAKVIAPGSSPGPVPTVPGQTSEAPPSSVTQPPPPGTEAASPGTQVAGEERIPGTVYLPPTATTKERLENERRNQERADKRLTLAERNAQRLEEQATMQRAEAARRQAAEDRMQRTAQNRDHLQRLAQTKDDFAELDTLEAADRLVDRVLPLLTRATVGPGAYLTLRIQGTLANLGLPNPYDNAVEQKIRATPGLAEAITDAQKEAMKLAMMSDNNFALQNTALFNADAPRVEILTALLQYVHAALQKSTQAGSSRGVTVNDINLARPLFEPAGLFTSVPQLIAKVRELRTNLQLPRSRIEAAIRRWGLDPKTGQLLTGVPTRPGLPPLRKTEPISPGAPDTSGEEAESEEDPRARRLRERYGTTP